MNLLLRQPNGSWQTCPLSNQAVIIGRDAACQVHLDDAQASRRHAIVWMSQGQCYIRDEGSTNGTYLNDQRIVSACLLRPGDQVRIGSTVLQLSSSAVPTVMASGPAPTVAAGGAVARQDGAAVAQPGGVAVVVSAPQAPAPLAEVRIQARRTSGMAVASLIMGILGLSPLAVIFGHVAMGEIKRSGGGVEGDGLAIAGLVLGYLGLSGWVILFLFLIAASSVAF